MTGFLADDDLSVNAIEAARRAKHGRYLDLSSSNPTHQGLLFPAEILRAAAEPYWSSRRYEPDPRGLLAARNAIAGDYALRGAGAAHPADQIYVTASTSEAYSLLFSLLCEPGDNVLGPSATYPLFEHLAAAHHVDLRSYRLDPSRGWAIDEASILAAADARTRAVLIITPHNPTGHIVPQALPALDTLRAPLIVDEVFAEFTYRATHTPVLAALHPEIPVFTLNGISKRFALPDLKLGWVACNAAAARQFGARLELLNDMFLGANSLTQHMLPTLFERGSAFVAQMRTHIRSNIEMALALLANAPHVHVRAPDGGYYLCARFAYEHDDEALTLRLLERGVLVHPGYFYGLEPDTEGAYVIVSCLTERETLRRGLELMLTERQNS